MIYFYEFSVLLSMVISEICDCMGPINICTGCKSLAFGDMSHSFGSRSFLKINMQPSSLLSQVVFSLQLKTGFYTLSLINPQIFNKSVHQGALIVKRILTLLKSFYNCDVERY